MAVLLPHHLPYPPAILFQKARESRSQLMLCTCLLQHQPMIQLITRRLRSHLICLTVSGLRNSVPFQARKTNISLWLRHQRVWTLDMEIMPAQVDSLQATKSKLYWLSCWEVGISGWRVMWMPSEVNVLATLTIRWPLCLIWASN